MKLFARLTLISLLAALPVSMAEAQNSRRERQKTPEELAQEQKFRPPDKQFPFGAVWVLREMNGKPVPGDLDVSFTLDKQGRGSGTSGCNSWSSPMVSVPGQKFAMGAIAMTKKACPPAVMTFERTYLQTLHSGPTWDIPTSDLIVKNAQTTLRFSRGF